MLNQENKQQMNNMKGHYGRVKEGHGGFTLIRLDIEKSELHKE